MTENQQPFIKYRLERANESIQEAKLLVQNGHWNTAVNRIYYACFYAVNALLLNYGMSSPKHTGVRSFFNQHFVKTNLFPLDLAAFYNQLFERRQESDYTDLFEPDATTVLNWIPIAETFVQAIEILISQSPPFKTVPTDVSP